MRVLLIGLVATTISLLLASANATETFVPAYGSVHRHERWHVRRIGPQSCYLMPDVAVAINALGPYCILLVKLRLTLQTLPVAQKHQTDLAKA